MNVFIDSDVYIIDVRYKRDLKFPINKEFLSLAIDTKISAFSSIFNLLEICGILSFNMNKQGLEQTFTSFSSTYNTNILFPKSSSPTEIRFDILDIYKLISTKIAFLDSLILSVFQEAEMIQTFVSWNAVHFRGKNRKRSIDA